MGCVHTLLTLYVYATEGSSRQHDDHSATQFCLRPTTGACDALCCRSVICCALCAALVAANMWT